MSPLYYLYDLEGNLVEKRPNPYGAGGGAHQHHDNPRLIVDLLPECDVFIARRMGDAGPVLAELHRVLKPGGVLATRPCLRASRPEVLRRIAETGLFRLAGCRRGRSF